MNKKRGIFTLIGISMYYTAIPACFAGGTVDFEEYVHPIMMKRPFFAKFVLDTFDLDKSASAVTIGREINQKLAGYRIGPYTVLAKKKGVPGPYTMEVTIDTNVHFYDKKGHELDGPENAKTVKEEFYAIEVNPLPFDKK